MTGQINEKEGIFIEIRNLAFFNEIRDLLLCFNVSFVDDLLIFVKRNLQSLNESLISNYLDLLCVFFFHNDLL